MVCRKSHPSYSLLARSATSELICNLCETSCLYGTFSGLFQAIFCRGENENSERNLLFIFTSGSRDMTPVALRSMLFILSLLGMSVCHPAKYDNIFRRHKKSTRIAKRLLDLQNNLRKDCLPTAVAKSHISDLVILSK